jgi:hypothetical protein
MSEPKTAGDFLKGLSATEYSRISDLLDEALDMTPADRETWLATLGGSDPISAAALGSLFAAQHRYQADKFLEDLPAVAGEYLTGWRKFLRGPA